MDFVFVYGTLKQGFHNHGYLSEAAFVGSAISVSDDKYRMGNVGGFPEVQIAKSGMRAAGTLAGEIYACDDNTIQLLDRLESNGTMYQRYQKEFFVHDINGESRSETCWVYLWLGEPTTPILPVDGELVYR